MENIVDSLNAVLPPKYQGLAAMLAVIVPLLGRAYHALRNGGGLVGIYRALMFGTNTPRPVTAPARTDDPNQTKLPLALLLCAFVPSCLIGCASSKPAKASGGVYENFSGWPHNSPQGFVRLLMLGLCIALFSGCSYSRITRGDASAVNLRCLWHTEGFEFEATTNGSTKIRLVKSNPDAESLKAIAQGVAEGAVKGAK